MKLGDHNVPYVHPSTMPATDAYRAGWDAVFGRKSARLEPCPSCGSEDPEFHGCLTGRGTQKCPGDIKP